MFKITLRVTARCPKHTRYNPERDGLAFRSGCQGCQRAHATYLRVMEFRRYLANEENEKGLITVEQKDWKTGPTECANADCKRNLREVAVIYTIRGKEIGFCSQACRATLTGEQVRTAPAATAVEDAGTTETKAPKGKKTVAASIPPSGSHPAKAQAPTNGKRTRSSTPVTGTLHFTDKKPPKFQGNRKQVWDLIKDGMTVSALLEQCAQAGLDGKGNLNTIVKGYGCVEIRN